MPPGSVRRWRWRWVTPSRRAGAPLRHPEQFLAHAKRSEVLADIGLTPVEIAGRIGASLSVADQARDGRTAMPVQGEN